VSDGGTANLLDGRRDPIEKEGEKESCGCRARGWRVERV
jgi:hypothetical protein